MLRTNQLFEKGKTLALTVPPEKQHDIQLLNKGHAFGNLVGYAEGFLDAYENYRIPYQTAEPALEKLYKQLNDAGTRYDLDFKYLLDLTRLRLGNILLREKTHFIESRNNISTEKSFFDAAFSSQIL